MRAHFLRQAYGADLTQPEVMTIRVLKLGSDEVLDDGLYRFPTGSQLISNPFSVADGMIEFYLERAQRVRLGITIGAGAERIWDAVDVFLPTESLAAVATSGSKIDVGLGSVDNTSDLDKPVSTATQAAIDLKENKLPAGTGEMFLRADKTWQTITKSSVGLGSVDNTSDLAKPISTAVQGALNGKSDTGHTHTAASLGMTPIRHVGGGSPNTSNWNVNDLWYDTSTEI